MPVGITVRVVGIDRAIQALRELDAEADRTLDAAVKAGALVVRNAASQNAPKLTGTLARSIDIERA